MKKIRDAVSLVFECQDDIFTIIRQNFLRAFPGYTAFIGGKVDPEDHRGEKFNLHILDEHPKHLMNALIRETQEEVGLEVERLIELGKIKSIEFIGQALAPDFNPYRYHTYFFRISFLEKPECRIDKNEIKSYKWSSAQSVIDEWLNGEIMMVPPVRDIIEAHCKDIPFKKKLFFDNEIELEKNVPCIESIHGLVQVMPLSNTVPPAERTNAFILGDDKKVLIDPSPKNENELSKFLETIKKYNINRIFITHHHKDHHQFVNKIALQLNCEILMSEYTFHRILKVYGETYFQKIKISFVKEGDILVRWLGEDIIMIEVPGHDEGQMAIMPKSAKWFLAGDLFQGVGTVVVGGEEGDMIKYLDTLNKVIKLAPRCVIPSHGIALGGTHIIEKTLEHRLFREKQILEMHKEGLNEDQMLQRIYFYIPEKTLKFARANIQSHFKKLKSDGKI